jgi:hypothetical protein
LTRQSAAAKAGPPPGIATGRSAERIEDEGVSL